MGSPPVTAALVKPPRSTTCQSVRQVNMGIRILELCNHTTFSRNQQNHVEEILKLVLEIIYTHSKLNFAQKTVRCTDELKALLKKKPDHFSNMRAFSVAVTTARTRGGILGCWTAFVSIQHWLSHKCCQLYGSPFLTQTAQCSRLR